MINTTRLICLSKARRRLELLLFTDVDVAVGMNGFLAIKKRSQGSARNVKVLNGMYLKRSYSQKENLLTKITDECKMAICAIKDLSDNIYIDNLCSIQF
jgi:hypothetical protein